MIPRIDLPGMLERGRDTALALNVTDDAGAQQSPTAASVVLYDGTEEVVSSVAATTLGPPASYTVPAATTSGRPLSNDWLAVWTMTIAGTEYVFSQPVYLVRRLLYPVITDDDLTAVHSDLDDLRNSASMATFEPIRALAWSRIQRGLIGRGNRPALILDPWALKDLHVFESLAIAYNDFASSLGDSRYRELAEDYRNMAKAEWGSLSFRYDEDEDGLIDGTDVRSASPVVFLTRPRWRNRWRT